MMTILVEEVNACLARINWGNNCSAADSAALEFLLLLLWDLGGSGGVGSAEAPRRPSEYGFCCCCCNCGRDRIPALELWSPLASTPGPIRTRSVWSYSSVFVFAAAAEEEEGGHTSFDSVVVGPSNDYYYSSLHSSTWTVIVTLSVIVHPSPPSPFSSSTLCYCYCYYSPPPPPPGLHPHKYHPRQLCPPIHQHYCRMYISLVRPPTIMY